jgi:tRNA(His) 5'-end guanylyltransferase
MDMAAKTVMTEYKDVILAFGESDEFRYVHKHFSTPSIEDS